MSILTTFHKNDINKQFVKEDFVRYIGQGLYNSGKTILIGNGHNRYIMEVEYQNKTGTVIFEEKHIEKWEISQTPEDGTDYECFIFEGLGLLNGEYYMFESTDDSLDQLVIIDDFVEFKINKIDVECYVSAPIKFGEDIDINLCRRKIRATQYECGRSVDYDEFMKNPGEYCLYDFDMKTVWFTKVQSRKGKPDQSDVIIGDVQYVMEHVDLKDDDVQVRLTYKNVLGFTKKIDGFCHIGSNTR